MIQDGIEIHFDEKRGYLELGCEPDAFAAYREVAREHLKDSPEIPIAKVMEIRIVDTATFVAKRETRGHWVVGVLFVVVLLTILVLAVVGATTVIGKFFGP
jgi:hypothetical protein